MNEQMMIDLVNRIANNDKVAPFQNGFVVLTNEEMVKFAELIVQECVKRIEGCGLDPAQYEFDREFVQGYNKAISKSASQVRLHFGVEE